MKSDTSDPKLYSVEKRKLIKFGNYSLCITLPKEVISKFKLKKGDEIDLTIDERNQKIIINLSEKTIVKKPITKPNDKPPSRW